MTLTTAAIIYYSLATPALLLLCKMMYVGGKDHKTRNYAEVLNEAHRKLTVNK